MLYYNVCHMYTFLPAGTGVDVDYTGAIAAEAEAGGNTVDYSSTDDRTVFVSNLSYQTTEQQLTDKFSQACSAYYKIVISSFL